MRLTTLQAALGLLLAHPAAANHIHGHRHAHEQYGRRHGHGHHSADELVGATAIQKRGAGCSLPTHPDLVPVPGKLNNGFAIPSDRSCDHDGWCPYACVSGKVMAQWQPNSTYVYPQSMNGGLHCNNGVAEKPFPDKPYCVDGTGAVQVVNKVGKIMSFCQTVLPGDESMVIRNDITDVRTIAVPDINYWDKTAAHYYINPPGVPSSDGCKWGTESEPIGNWSPYVAGANTVANGDTYVKIAWNPMFIGCPLKNKKPSFGVRIECPDGGCNGLPCSINPGTDGVGGLSSPVKATGVGDADFCVVTVPSGKTANIVVFNIDGSEPGPASSSVPPPSTSATKAAPTSSATPTSSSVWSSTSTVAKPSSSAAPSYFPGGIFHENSTSTDDGHSFSQGSTTKPSSNQGTTQGPSSPVETASKNEGAADQSGTAIAGLIVALVAAAALY
ncbi:hypothetical protein QBC47DRAFT_200317 [Echria macrotheca]|uniref:Uncharacterized protein n=1 Tax=Echria macrotheca TaxID=438768 RepID=A0AAJ0BHG0_9PEZI|nr:hypothetical protein QBC47DRAFT_200317 [Echria macrotheca]